MDDHDDAYDEHQELPELLVPYALGQLDAAAATRVKRALDTDPELRAQYAEIEAVGARLAASVPAVAAPPALRSRVLDAVAAAAVPHPVEPLRRERVQRSRWRFALPSLAAGFAAATLVLAGVAINLDRKLDDTASDLKAATSEGAGRPSGAPAGFEGSTIHPVSTSGDMAPASGSLINVGGDQMLLVLRDVPEPGEGNSWQVWTADSDGTIQNVAQWISGGETQIVAIDRTDITEVMVSFEETTTPVPAPTSAPVADVKV
jgi:hypothetical protein